MPTSSSSRSWMRRWSRALLLCGSLLLLLAGCSLSSGTGSGGSSLSLGLAGSTADQPSKPPSLAQGGPGGTYAFVYDNQVWLRTPGHDLKQLTHLVLSNGANIAWGPLVWSPSGKYIAFSLVESLNPDESSSSAGPIYIVDTSSGSTIVSGGTGSIYGHSYVFYGDSMLFYSAGGAIDMFGPYGCDACDPRTWTVVSPQQAQGAGAYSGQSIAYGDLAIANTTLFFTQITLTSLGGAGAVGSVAVQQTQIDIASNDTVADDYVSAFPFSGYSSQVADLGQAYAGPHGSISAGAWDLSGATLVVQHVDHVDARAGQVTSSFCSYSLGGYGACASLLSDAGKSPLSAKPGLSVGGGRVAYSNGKLYVANVDGSHEATLDNAGWTMPPSVSSDGKLVAVTQLVSQTTAASGVVHSTTNVLTYDGTHSLTFVPGGQDFSFQP